MHSPCAQATGRAKHGKEVLHIWQLKPVLIGAVLQSGEQVDCVNKYREVHAALQYLRSLVASYIGGDKHHCGKKSWLNISTLLVPLLEMAGFL